MHISRAAEKLRNQQSAAGSVTVFIQVSRFKPGPKFEPNALTIPVPSHTDDTRQLVKVALWGLRRLYQKGFEFTKAGVMLGELVPLEGVQTDLFSTTQTTNRTDKAIETMDAINQKWGRSTIKLASEGVKKSWKMRSENRSPCYTTRWEDLPVIYD